MQRVQHRLLGGRGEPWVLPGAACQGPVAGSHQTLDCAKVGGIANSAHVPGWEPPAEARRGIALALPDFLTGLAVSPGLLAGAALSRQVADIVRVYVQVWPPAASPLLPVLRRPALPLAAPALVQLQQLALSALVNLAMTSCKQQQTRDTAIQVIDFLKLALEEPDGEATQHIVTAVLPFLLDTVTRIDIIPLRNSAMRLLQQIINEQDQRDIVTEKLLSFVREHIAFNSDRLFKTLTVVAVTKPQFTRSLIKSVQLEVEAVETKRGGGKDSNLRQLLTSFEDTVYEKM